MSNQIGNVARSDRDVLVHTTAVTHSVKVIKWKILRREAVASGKRWLLVETVAHSEPPFQREALWLWLPRASQPRLKTDRRMGCRAE